MTRREWVKRGALWVAGAPLAARAQILPFPGPGRAPAGSSPSYLVEEGFEGTGAPASWTSSGTVDWDEATIFHDGAQALQVDSTSADSYAQTPTFTCGADCYGEFWFYPDHIPSTDAIVFRLYNNTTELGRIEQRSTGVLRVQAIGGTAVNMTLSIGEDSWVRVWFHFTQGSGANATMRAWWATTDTHPGNSNAQYYAASSNGTTTAVVDRIRLFSDNIGTTNGSRFYDNLVVDDAILW